MGRSIHACTRSCKSPTSRPPAIVIICDIMQWVDLTEQRLPAVVIICDIMQWVDLTERLPAVIIVTDTLV